MSTDPTAIDIDFDPEHQRMKGVAFNGNTPFDVPYISNILGNLYQGGCRDGLILPKYIKRVFSLYPWERYTMNSNVELAEIKMYDSEEQTFEQVDEIAFKVVDHLWDTPTLVHCQAGLNRSSLIAARVLMIHDGFTAADAVKFLRERRSPACLCNRSFEEWILGLDEESAA